MLILAIPVFAQDSGSSSSGWEKSFEVYLVAAELNITDQDGTEIQFKFKDILKNLDMAAMVDFGMQKDQWSFGVDSMYMNLGNTVTRSGAVIGHPVELLADIDMRAFISTLSMGYAVSESTTNRTEIVGGIRYLYVRTPTDFYLNDNSLVSFRPSGHTWDGVVGIQGVKTINDRWAFDYYADIGTGQSDLTWQTKLGFSYEFNKWTGTFGFRYMSWNFDDKGAFADLNLIGPYAGARWTW
jgi:hypothetical protein